MKLIYSRITQFENIFIRKFLCSLQEKISKFISRLRKNRALSFTLFKVKTFAIAFFKTGLVSLTNVSMKFPGSLSNMAVHCSQCIFLIKLDNDLAKALILFREPEPSEKFASLTSMEILRYGATDAISSVT